MRFALLDRPAVERVRKDTALMLVLTAAVSAPALHLCPACVLRDQDAGGLCTECARTHRAAA